MLYALALLFTTTMVHVVAQDNRPEDPNNHFVYPPLPADQFLNNDPSVLPSVFCTNIIFTVGEIQLEPFKWVSNMTSMRLELYQQGGLEDVQSHVLTGNSN